MKKLLIYMVTSIVILGARAQSDVYVVTSGEMIFSSISFSETSNDGSVIRWAPVFSTQTLINKDLGKSFGVFAGFAFRNVGFIADDPVDQSTRKKFRTYNVGVPLGIKFGNLNKTFIYGGFDAEYAFNYKEKTFVDDNKVGKETYWFTDKINQWQPSVNVGIQLVKGSNIKFKYYLNSFFNANKEDVYDQEYRRFDGNVFYISLNANLFYNKRFYYN